MEAYLDNSATTKCAADARVQRRETAAVFP